MGKISRMIVDKYYELCRKRGKPAPDPKKLLQYRKLYPMEDAESLIRKQDSRLVSVLGACLIVTVLAGSVWLLMGTRQEAVRELKRPGIGKQEMVYELEVERENGERIPVEIALDGMVPGKEEIEKLLKAAEEEVLNVLDAGGRDHVTGRIRLPETAQDGLVIVDWTSQTRDLMDDDGTVQKENGKLDPDGEQAKFLMSLSCQDQVRETEVLLKIYPILVKEEERFLEKLRSAIEEQKGEQIHLPEKENGETLIWYRKEEVQGIWLILIPVCLLLYLPFRAGSRRRDQLKKREKELLLDYPELVSRFTVLLQAGISVRNIWERIVKEYEKRTAQGEPTRYVYEEMRFTWKQLENGRYESRAYGEFGKRCGLHAYMKFGALLEQNLKQGTTKLAIRLKEESESAFEERKNLARRLGEEAETKLMLPMFLMLFVVLAAVMTPAFLSF